MITKRKAHDIPMLKTLRLTNYRSFKNETINFENLTVLIGPNAAGKSNLLNAITFFRTLAEHGLDDAVSMQGGIDYIRNVRLSKTDPTCLGLDLIWPSLNRSISLFRYRTQDKENLTLRVSPPLIRYRKILLSYDIVLGVEPRTKQPQIISESLKMDFELAIIPRKDRDTQNDNATWHISSFCLNVKAGHCSLPQLKTTAPNVTIHPALDFDTESGWYNPSEPLIRQVAIIFGLEPMQALSKIPRYDIDPTLGKSAIPVTGRAELEEDGDNLPSALRSILNKPKDCEKFLSLVSDALPHVKNVKVSSFSDMTRFLQVREIYGPSDIPGYLLSDGTIDVITFIVALYFQNAFLTLFEEPDRGLHPAMVRKIGAMMVEESEQRQVIATTHSTELINSVPKDSVLCIARNEDGSSTVFQPSKSSRFKEFLDSMGIGQLNSAGLLSTKAE